MKVEQDQVTNAQDYEELTEAPTMDYKMECDRLWKENHTQETIIKALVFYIQGVKE